MFEMLDTLIFLWIPEWSTWCTLIHDVDVLGGIVPLFIYVAMD